MNRRSFGQLAAVLALAGALLGASVWLQRVRDRAYPASDVTDDSLYLTSGRALGRLTLAYQAVAADLYWIRAIQYYGGTKQMLGAQPHSSSAADARVVETSHHEYALLYPLLDLATSLDPRFNIAYRFGAIFLAEPYPGGPGRPDLAIALLEKGLRERPDKWEYMQDIGFVHYWWLRDYRAAAAWFDKASRVPGGPWWLRSLAATTLAQGRDRRSSRMMWEAVRQSAELDWLRRDAERRLTQLQALDQIDALQRVVDRFSARIGQPVTDWMTLVGVRALPGIPVDPTGTRYELDARGRVRLSESSSLFPLPEEPASLAVRPVS